MPYNRYNTGQGYEPNQQEADWLGGMAYNPYSSGTDFGFALRNTLNNLLAHKQQQKQVATEQQRYDAEQTRLAKADELAQKREMREQSRMEADALEGKARSEYYSAQALAALGKKDKTFAMSPVALKSLAKTLNLPQEVVDNVSAMNPEAQEDFFTSSLTGLNQLRLEQERQKGPLADAGAERAQLAKEKEANRVREARLKSQAGMITAATTGMQRLKVSIQKQIDSINKDILLLRDEKTVALNPLQSQLDNIDTASGELAAYFSMLGMGQELPDEAVAKVTKYLSNPSKIKSGEIWAEESPITSPQTTAPPSIHKLGETRQLDGVTYTWDGTKWNPNK